MGLRGFFMLRLNPFDIRATDRTKTKKLYWDAKTS